MGVRVALPRKEAHPSARGYGEDGIHNYTETEHEAYLRGVIHAPKPKDMRDFSPKYTEQKRRKT